MNYLFTGNSDFLVNNEVLAWKNHFVTKYGEFNLLHIKDLNSIDNNFLTLNITSGSFLSEKKLIIIDIITNEKTKTNNDGIDEKKESDKENLLLNLLTKVPDENIVLIKMIKPDKRGKFYKSLQKLCEIKEYNTKDDKDLFSHIKKKYPNGVTNIAIETLIRYKSGNLNKIISEIDKLLITYDKIDKQEVVENIIPELEESIFQVIDDILNKHIVDAIKKIETILNDTNIYAFYNNLIANLRTSVYIYKMKDLGKKTSEISQLLDLGNRTFLIEKKYKISYKEIKKIYINLLDIDKKMKSGKLFGTEESDFLYELEKKLVTLK